MTYDVIIVGGGLAGLSAAVDLSMGGRKILLLEQKPHFGGRTYSFRDRKTGDIVDNGQHLMMGCYRETIHYLEAIGSSHLASLQPRLHIDFLHPTNGSTALDCPSLPAPLNVLAGLLRLRTLPFSHRLRLLRLGSELLSSSKRKEQELARLTVDEWLRRSGQTEENRKYLWDVIAIGTLNDSPKNVSALLFYRVLKAAFTGRRLDASLLIPRTGLSEILVDPAVRFIEQRGGTVLASSRVDSFLARGKRMTGVRVGRREFRAQTVISAIPYFSYGTLRWSGPVDGQFSRFVSSPIITIYLWYDRQVFEREFAAVLDSTIQWVFNKTAIFGSSGNLQCLSLVISGAAKQVEWPNDRLVRAACKELERVLPASRGLRPKHVLVIKEKRATFSATPEILLMRPSTKTAVENFFLAGDWTETRYPATIEGAVMSGRNAAAAAKLLLPLGSEG